MGGRPSATKSARIRRFGPKRKHPPPESCAMERRMQLRWPLREDANERATMTSWNRWTKGQPPTRQLTAEFFSFQPTGRRTKVQTCHHLHPLHPTASASRGQRVSSSSRSHSVHFFRKMNSGREIDGQQRCHSSNIHRPVPLWSQTSGRH